MHDVRHRINRQAEWVGGMRNSHGDKLSKDDFRNRRHKKAWMKNVLLGGIFAGVRERLLVRNHVRRLDNREGDK